MIEQLYTVITPEPYIITGGKAERRPVHGAYTRTSVTMGEHTLSAGLNLADDVDLASAIRWLPDQTKLVLREDLEPDMTQWLPSYGSVATFWREYVDATDQVDTAYTYSARGDEMVVKPALVMDGTSWFKLNRSLVSGPEFTIAIVLMLHESAINAPILASYSDDFEEGSNPLVLAQEADNLVLYIGEGSGLIDATGGAKMVRKQLSNLNNRPAIIILSTDGSSGSLVVVDHTPYCYGFRHPPLQADDLSLYLGRPPIITEGVGQGIMQAEIMEIALWDETMDAGQLWALGNQLDSIYGITK